MFKRKDTLKYQNLVTREKRTWKIFYQTIQSVEHNTEQFTVMYSAVCQVPVTEPDQRIYEG